MKIDFADVFGSALGETVLRLAAWFGAFWMASTIAFVSLMTGEAVESRSLHLSHFPFELLILIWVVPGMIALAGIIGSVLLQIVGVWQWSIVCSALSLAMVGIAFRSVTGEPVAIAALWATWLILVSSVTTSLWFLRQWQLNRWAGQMAMLKAENAARRALLQEERGIDRRVPDNENYP